MANKTITEERYNNLVKAEKFLHALQDCGVDNWEGYSEAIRLAFPEGDEDDDC